MSVAPQKYVLNGEELTAFASEPSETVSYKAIPGFGAKLV